MKDTFFEQLAEGVSRRYFIERAASASSAVVLALLGFSEVAEACSSGCCHLCGVPPLCSYSNCAAEWMWVCEYIPPAQPDRCKLHCCKECYSISPGSNCTYAICDDGGPGVCTCNHVKCNQEIGIGTC
jgi:hypothetical protein